MVVKLRYPGRECRPRLTGFTAVSKHTERWRRCSLWCARARWTIGSILIFTRWARQRERRIAPRWHERGTASGPAQIEYGSRFSEGERQSYKERRE